MVLYLKLRQRREYTINLRTHKLKSFLLIWIYEYIKSIFIYILHLLWHTYKCRHLSSTYQILLKHLHIHFRHNFKILWIWHCTNPSSNVQQLFTTHDYDYYRDNIFVIGAEVLRIFFKYFFLQEEWS
jgi:hypothetical protein